MPTRAQIVKTTTPRYVANAAPRRTHDGRMDFLFPLASVEVETSAKRVLRACDNHAQTCWPLARDSLLRALRVDVASALVVGQPRRLLAHPHPHTHTHKHEHAPPKLTHTTPHTKHTTRFAFAHRAARGRRQMHARTSNNSRRRRSRALVPLRARAPTHTHTTHHTRTHSHCQTNHARMPPNSATTRSEFRRCVCVAGAGFFGERRKKRNDNDFANVCTTCTVYVCFDV